MRESKSTLETSFDVGLSGNGRLHDLFLKYEACTPGEFKNEGEGMMIHARTLEGKFLATAVQEIFAEAAAAYIQVHNARPVVPIARSNG